MNEVLHCKAGDHDWTRERKRGAKPKNCPEHQTEKDRIDREEHMRKMAEGRERAQRERNCIKIRNVLDYAKEHFTCHCDIDPGVTLEELVPLGGGCKMPMWCCPVLDRVRRELEA